MQKGGIKKGRLPQTVVMKRYTLRSSLLAGAAALFLSFSTLGAQKGELTDIAKPYLGIYECTQAQLNNHDLLESLDGVKLELQDKGEYTFYYKEKGGKTKKVQGKYLYDGKRETLTFYLPDCSFIHREFPLKKGTLTVSVPYGDKMLVLQFEQK